MIKSIKRQLTELKTCNLTCQEIAELSGVNATTVWRAINLVDGVKLATLEKFFGCGLLTPVTLEIQLKEAKEIINQCQHWNPLAKNYIAKYERESPCNH